MALPRPKEPEFNEPEDLYDAKTHLEVVLLMGGLGLIIIASIVGLVAVSTNFFVGRPLEYYISAATGILLGLTIIGLFFILRFGLFHHFYEFKYVEAYKKYNVELTTYAASLRKDRMASVNATAAKFEARRKAAERDRAERARRQAQIDEENRQHRIRAWNEAFNWARTSFEQQYHGFALTLAAEQGITNPDDVLKVFAEAYPHLNISSDGRMGLLRELAADPRIAAILPHLPSAIARPA